MADENVSIRDAVKTAAAAIEGKEEVKESNKIEVPMLEDTEETETEEESTEETEESTEEEAEENEENEEEKKELSEAEKVWQALNSNPIETLQFFAKQVGANLVLNEGAKEPTKEQKTAIVDILSKHLGENYSFMAPQLAGALEEILSSKVDARFQQQETNQELSFVESEIISHTNSDKLSDQDKTKVTTEMGRLFKLMPPNYSNKAELKNYVRNIYVLASQDVKKNGKAKDEVKERVKRQTQNLQDEEPSSVSAGGFISRKRPAGTLTHKQAVELAMKGVQLTD